MMQQAYLPSGYISQSRSKFKLDRLSSYRVVQIHPNSRTSTDIILLTFDIVDIMQNEDNMWRILANSILQNKTVIKIK